MTLADVIRDLEIGGCLQQGGAYLPVLIWDYKDVIVGVTYIPGMVKN